MSPKLPVRLHNEPISKQFALACHLPQHPCHHLSHRPSDDRPDRRQSLIGQLKQTSSNKSLNRNSAKQATNRPSSVSIMMRSELPLKAAHQSCLLADDAHWCSRTDTAEEDKNYAGTISQRSQPYPCSVHQQNQSGSALPLPRLWSLHPPPIRLTSEAVHTNTWLVMDCADRSREAHKHGEWWDDLTTASWLNGQR